MASRQHFESDHGPRGKNRPQGIDNQAEKSIDKTSRHHRKRELRQAQSVFTDVFFGCLSQIIQRPFDNHEIVVP
jgi:hypothetical protein